MGKGKKLRDIRVGNVDVVQLEVGSLDTEGGSLVVGETICLRQTMGDGDLVARVAGIVLGVAVDGQLGTAGRDEDLFVIGAGVDEDALRGS